MFERFTDRARRVLVLAQEESRLFRHDFIGTEHLLLGLLREGEGVGAEALAALGVSLTSVRDLVDEIVGRDTTESPGAPPFTPRAKRALEMSLREAFELGHEHIGTEHLLLGLLREPEGVTGQILARLGVAPADVDALVKGALGAVPGRRDPLDAVAAGDVEPAEPPDAARLLPWSDASEVLAAALASQPRVQRREIHGVVYETCAYAPEPLPRILVAVARARVSREAFDGHTERLPEAAAVDGLGDAATYDAGTSSLRMLVGTTLVVVQVRLHPERRRIALDVARRVLANLAAPRP